MSAAPVLQALIQRLGAVEAAQTTAQAMLDAATTTANIAMIAAMLSFVGVVVTGIIARRNGFVQARTTQQLKHAEFRQKWIDELRFEMGNFTRLVAGKSPLSEGRPELLQSMSMILFRMDSEDEDFDRLFQMMMEAIGTAGSTSLSDEDAIAFARANSKFVNVCKDILKREWEVLKREMHSTPWGWPISSIVAKKRRRRREERVEINRRLRTKEDLTPNSVILSLWGFNLTWKRRQRRILKRGETRSIGRLRYWRELPRNAGDQAESATGQPPHQRPPPIPTPSADPL